MLETLRPNGIGDETNLFLGGSVPAPTNWQSVDEAVADDDTTHVRTNSSTYKREFYNIEDSASSGFISHIKVYARCKMAAVEANGLKICIKSGTGSGAPDTPDESVEKSLTSSWANYDNVWTKNPATDNDWEEDEIENLQIGISIKDPQGSFWLTWCTQVYVEVNYTLPGKTLAQNEQPLASDINTIFQWGTIGARPATEDVLTGSFYVTTDTHILYQEQNGVWVGVPFG